MLAFSAGVGAILVPGVSELCDAKRWPEYPDDGVDGDCGIVVDVSKVGIEGTVTAFTVQREGRGVSVVTVSIEGCVIAIEGRYQ